MYNFCKNHSTVSDDMRINIGVYQESSHMKSISQPPMVTPSIDALARRGVMFERVRWLNNKQKNVQLCPWHLHFRPFAAIHFAGQAVHPCWRAEDLRPQNCFQKMSRSESHRATPEWSPYLVTLRCMDIELWILERYVKVGWYLRVGTEVIISNYMFFCLNLVVVSNITCVLTKICTKRSINFDLWK